MQIGNRSRLFLAFVIFAVASVAVLSASITAIGGAPEEPVDLGTSGDFVILSKAGITTTGTTSIVGDMGVSPIDSTAITGFSLIMDSSNEFSTSALVDGKIYASDYASPTPSMLTTAVSDMETAYTDAATRVDPDATELGGGTVTGVTFAPGLYKWTSNVSITGDITLDGPADGVWIFQIAQNLTLDADMSILLSGGVLSEAPNVFWQVAGEVNLMERSHFEGVILSAEKIAMRADATFNGRLLSQTQVTLISNTIEEHKGAWTLSILAPVGDGTTDLAIGDHLYNVGEDAEVTATPDAGWHLSHWLLDDLNIGVANPLTVLSGTAGQVKTLRPVFALDRWTLSILPPEGSGVTIPATGDHIYNVGTDATVTAYPEPGWAFDYWLLDDVNVGDTNPIIVLSGVNGQTKTLKAVYVQKEIKASYVWGRATRCTGVYTRTGVTNENPRGTAWQKIPGALAWVTVAPQGVWGVNKWGAIYYRDSLEADSEPWQMVPGYLNQISAGPTGAVWGVQSWTGQIYLRSGITAITPTGTGWVRIPGSLVNLDVGARGVWGVNSVGRIYYRDSLINDAAPWVEVPGVLRRVSVGPNGAVWGISPSGLLYVRKGITAINPVGTHWVLSPGNLTELAIGNGLIWGINASDNIYFRPSVTDDSVPWELIPGLLHQISVGGVIAEVEPPSEVFNLIEKRTEDGADDAESPKVSESDDSEPAVINYPPVADAGGDRKVRAGRVVMLTGSGSFDPDGEIVLYEWDMNNDGMFETMGMNVNTLFYSPGSFTVRLRITDDGGAKDVDSAVITVE